MSEFKPGDRVLVDFSLVAEIQTYDTDSDRLVIVSRAGGSENTIYGHISNTRLEHLPESTPVVGTGDEVFTGEAQPAPEAVEENDTEAPKDEFTTLA